MEDPRAPSRLWRSIVDIFPRGKRRGMQAELRKQQAYQNVFHGNPSREDQSIVLADLANVSGFYRVTAAKGSTSRELWQAEGARLLFGATIYANLTLSEADRLALEQAARREAATDADEAKGKN